MASRGRIFDLAELLTTSQAAAYVGYSARHMQRMRSQGAGPRWVVLEETAPSAALRVLTARRGRIGYLRDDLDAWLAVRHG